MSEDIFIFHANAVVYWRLNTTVNKWNSIFLIYSRKKVKFVNLSKEVSVINEITRIFNSNDSFGEWISYIFDLWRLPNGCLSH